MNLRKSVLPALLAVLMAPLASAETVNDYKVDFDGLTDGVLADDWVPGTGWDHVVHSSFSGHYSGNTTYGVGSTPCLKVGYLSNWYDPNSNPGDLLVTPPVSGTVTMQIRCDSYESGVAFYAMTENDGTFTKGDQLFLARDPYNKPKNLVRDEWVKVEFEIPANTRLGIEAYAVYLDDFTATSAEVVKKKALSVAKVTSPELSYADTNPDGLFKVTYTAKVRNSGDFDLSVTEEGEEKFSVSLVNADNPNIVYVTEPITPADLFIGEFSDEITLETIIATGDYEPVSFAVKENLTGTIARGSTITPIKYEPKLSYSSRSELIADGQEQNFGTTQKAATITYSIKNDGAASGVINNVTVPAGYTTNLTAGTEVAPHTSVDFSITKTEGQGGEFNGDFVIETNAGTFTMALKGTTVDANAWFVDFEDGKIPADANMTGTPWTTESINYSLYLTGNKLALVTPSTGTGKFITPRLAVKEGESLKFEAQRKSDASNLKVYWSTDRADWQLLKEITVEGEDTETTGVFSTENTGGWYATYYFKQFELTNVPAGEGYLAFEAGNVAIDNLVGFSKAKVDADCFISASNLPATGEVNSTYTASATVKNSSEAPAEAGTFTATLYFGDKAVATVSSPRIDTGAETVMTLAFTPHAVETAEVHIEVTGGILPAVSATTSVEIQGEKAVSGVTVGNTSSTSYGRVPASVSEVSETEFVYSAEALAKFGLKAGDRINGLSFRGTFPKEIAANLTIKMTNVAEGTAYSGWPLTKKLADNAETTTVFSGAYTYPQLGSYSWSGNVYEALPLINFSGEPFVYDGQALIISVLNTPETVEYLSSTYFQNDSDYYNYSIYRSTSSPESSPLSEQSFRSDALPVTTFNLVVDDVVLSGKVTDKDDNALEGVQVTAESGNVLYTATTDAEGKYSMPIIKNGLTYTVTYLKAGFAPAFSRDVKYAENTEVNITLSPAAGLAIKSTEVPAEGMVNSPVVVKTTLINPYDRAVAAGEYSVNLKVNDETAATAESVEIAPLGLATFTLLHTPHAEGTLSVSVEAAMPEAGTAVSDAANVAVNPEVSTSEVVVVKPDRYLTNGPVTFNSGLGEAQTIYTAEQVGLAAGSNISRIKYYGYITDDYYGNKSTVKGTVKVWLENTDAKPTMDSNAFAETAFDRSSAEPLWSGEVNLESAGSSDEPILLLDIPVNFTYTGGNLRVATYSELESSSYNVYYAVNYDIEDQLFYRTAYSGETKLPDSWSRSYSTPSVTLEIDNRAEVEAAVVDFKGRPVENARVELTSGDVLYSGTTDAEGLCTITVLRPSLRYGAKAFATNFLDAETDSVAPVAASKVQADFTMHSQSVLTVNVRNSADNSAVSGATLTLADAEAEVKAGETEGTYVVTVADAEGKYTLNVTAEGMEPGSATVDLAPAYKGVITVTLDPVQDGIKAVSAADSQRRRGVYAIDGRFLGNEVPAKLAPGVYIINGRKTVVR